MNSIAEGMALKNVFEDLKPNREAPEWSQILSRQAAYFELLLIVASNEI